MSAVFILYACPIGKLSQQVQEYYQRSREECGFNPAHRYMPHCSLTGFFEEAIASVPLYLEALDRVYERANKRDLQIEVKELCFQEQWHGLVLQAPGVLELAANFAEVATSPTRSEPIRLKTWPHLSLAYGFDEQVSDRLKQLAIEIVAPNASTSWELRFYQRHSDWTWTCHQSWRLRTIFPQ